MGLWDLLRTSSSKLKTFFTNRERIDVKTQEELEDLLLACDFGYKTVEELKSFLQKQRSQETPTLEEVSLILRDQISSRLQQFEKKIILSKKPYVILMVGVNGSGKTTTIPKLSHLFKGKKIEWAACDRFRAGAKDQIAIWAKKMGIFLHDDEIEVAALAYRSFESAKKNDVDLLFIDTAGRLQNNKDFMDELGKIVRVLKKIDQEAPHEIIIVLDGTVGQNALMQIKLFKECVPLTGCVMTKMDGTSKGGVLVQLVDAFHVPIIGFAFGESIEDFEYFDAQKFSKSVL
jgi:fused signal recognition particle receptor